MIELRKAIEDMIVSAAKEKGMQLSAQQLKDAANGVEYWVMEGIGDSIDTALDMVEADKAKQEMEEKAQRYIVNKFPTDFILFEKVDKRYSNQYGWEYYITYRKNGLVRIEIVSQARFSEL